ncbi:uncharacterized protein LJ206_019727 [Theristicus caerulescens]
MASPAVGPCPRPLPPSAPASMRRRPPGPTPRPGSPAAPPEPMGGRSPGSPGGARAARRRLRRRGGAPRLLPDVRSIFAVPREPAELGRGHRFALRPPPRGWCDLCGEAVRERALRCDYCRYTCHQECSSLIQLDCRRPGQCQSQLSPEGTLLPPHSQDLDALVQNWKWKRALFQRRRGVSVGRVRSQRWGSVGICSLLCKVCGARPHRHVAGRLLLGRTWSGGNLKLDEIYLKLCITKGL